MIDKLGVKPDSRVAVLGVQDEEFWKQVTARTPHVTKDEVTEGADLTFLRVASRAHLAQLTGLRTHMKSNGMIWVVFPRGTQQIREVDVLSAAKEAGLVDVKVVRFSDTHTALKLVIPLARRKAHNAVAKP